jgi:hypothetical protein
MPARAGGGRHGAAVVHPVDVPLAAVTEFRHLLYIEELREC